jgi:hypothetical protein
LLYPIKRGFERQQQKVQTAEVAAAVAIPLKRKLMTLKPVDDLDEPFGAATKVPKTKRRKLFRLAPE